MTLQTFGGIVGRAIMQMIGGMLISWGLLTQADLNGFMGAGVVILGVLWSILVKYGKVLITKHIALEHIPVDQLKKDGVQVKNNTISQ